MNTKTKQNFNNIRPRNILINEDCKLKIADFGLARIYNESNNTSIANMTDYITTRWYRAPEVIVGFPSYTFSVDIWAVGCILVELITRQPLFPGSDSLKQLELITRRLGKPSIIFIQQIIS